MLPQAPRTYRRSPYAACPSPFGAHSWGSTTAVNTANAYRKCAVLWFEQVYPYTEAGRRCDTGTEVRAQVTQCPYPNDRSDSLCGRLLVKVGNDTGVSHGLRGVGFF